MIAHGVPNHQTAWLAERLNIQSIADLGNLSVIHVVRVPHHLRAALIRLRLTHGAAEDGWEAFAAPDFDVDADHNWNTYDAQELQRLANVALNAETLADDLQEHIQGLLNNVNDIHANVHAAVAVSDSDSDEESAEASEAEASSATASTEQFEDSSDAGGPEDAGDVGGAEDAQIAYE